MKVGCPTETKKHEYRVGLTPDNVLAYKNAGHEVFVQQGAGAGSGFGDEQYAAAGATLVPTAAEVWNSCDMIVKVKEPLADEYAMMRDGQILYTYLHLAADRQLTDELLARGVSAIAYETIRGRDGGLPLLKPMSEVAGRLSIQEGAKCLERPMGGMGLLLGGVPGVPKARVTIVGGGVVGANACKVAIGMGAEVTILDNNLDRLTYLDDIFGSSAQTLYSQEAAIEKAVVEADLVIGAVLIPGGATPKLIKKKYLPAMKNGSVIVDVAVDQGGCCETSRPTYHDNPTFVIDGVVHYCVGNMPGAVARTSTIALTNATLRYGLALAGKGVADAARADAGLFAGVNCYRGKLTCKEVAESFALEAADLNALL